MTDGDPLEVCVVCSTYRRADRLPRLVAALEAQTFPRHRFEVRIVDNGSHDDTAEVLAGLAARSPLELVPLALDVNDGPAAARNLGWRTTTAPLVAFTDDDCVPEPGWLAAAVAAMGASPEVGVAQGPVTRGQDVPLGPWTLFREHRGPTPYFEACNVVYRRAALEETGGFPEDVGWYGEDAEAGWRVVDAGWRRAFVEGAVVAHDVEERPFTWHLRNTYLERNLVGLATRHPGFAAEAFWRPWAYQRESAAMSLALIGLAGGLVRRPLLALALPWLWLRWPRRGYRSLPLLGPQRAALDVVKVAGHVVGSVRHRTVVL
jgi:GT2 family glycosyltransferase